VAGVKFWPFPLTLIVVLTTLSRSTVRECDAQTASEYSSICLHLMWLWVCLTLDWLSLCQLNLLLYQVTVDTSENICLCSFNSCCALLNSGFIFTSFTVSFCCTLYNGNKFASLIVASPSSSRQLSSITHATAAAAAACSTLYLACG